MNTLETIKARRAVKNYDPEYVIPEEQVQLILEHVIAAPTSFNIQHWRFVLVKDTSLKNKIKEAAWGQAQITDASLLFVLCADLKAWEREPERYWKNAPTAVQELLVPKIKPFYAGKEELQRDEALRSIGMAAQTMMLASKALGYDSCPMIGFDSEKVAKLIQLPVDHLIGMLVVIGKATKAAWPKPGQLPLEKVLFFDTFE